MMDIDRDDLAAAIHVYMCATWEAWTAEGLAEAVIEHLTKEER